MASSWLPPLPPRSPADELRNAIAVRGEHVFRQIGASVVILDGARYLVESTAPSWTVTPLPVEAYGEDHATAALALRESKRN